MPKEVEAISISRPLGSVRFSIEDLRQIRDTIESLRITHVGQNRDAIDIHSMLAGIVLPLTTGEKAHMRYTDVERIAAVLADGNALQELQLIFSRLNNMQREHITTDPIVSFITAKLADLVAQSQQRPPLALPAYTND